MDDTERNNAAEKEVPSGHSRIRLEGVFSRSRLERSGFEIIKVHEVHGRFRKAIPIMPLPLAIFCCILNIGAPGIGTLVTAFACFCCRSEYESKGEAVCNNVLAGFLQLVTTIILVGWIWSLYWGILFVSLAITKGEEKNDSPSKV